MALDIKFDCCYENEHEGIYLEVEQGSECVELTFFKDFNPDGSVCLRRDDVERLIKVLQENLKNI
jgi:hypothetical protein